jgi:uncharacterized membrane protein
LQAGTYYTWASGVMPGLGQVDDRTFVTAMRHMNTAIVNPVFMISFLGAPALAGVAVATSSRSARPWAVAALAFAVTTVVITGAGNIPLNNALESAGPVDEITDLAAVRVAFEDAWVRWNLLRAIASTASLGSLAWAMWRS